MKKRIRNGRVYYRWTETIHGKRHWRERKIPPGKILKWVPKSEDAKLIFSKYPEGHIQHIPLLLLYKCNVTPKEAYNISYDQLNLHKGTWRVGGELIFLDRETVAVLHKQVNKILQLMPILQFKPIRDPDGNIIFRLCIYPDGRPVKETSIKWVTHVIRRDINPNWSWRTFAEKSSS